MAIRCNLQYGRPLMLFAFDGPRVSDLIAPRTMGSYLPPVASSPINDQTTAGFSPSHYVRQAVAPVGSQGVFDYRYRCHLSTRRSDSQLNITLTYRVRATR